jgi:hypothetical protein
MQLSSRRADVAKLGHVSHPRVDVWQPYANEHTLSLSDAIEAGRMRPSGVWVRTSSWRGQLQTGGGSQMAALQYPLRQAA